jgi:hypothetical protein
MKNHSSPIRYVVSKVASNPRGQEFFIAQQYLTPSIYPGSDPSYSNEWVAHITVTPTLDVILEDQEGSSDLERIERVVLGCALRGPD